MAQLVEMCRRYGVTFRMLSGDRLLVEGAGALPEVLFDDLNIRADSVKRWLINEQACVETEEQVCQEIPGAVVEGRVVHD